MKGSVVALVALALSACATHESGDQCKDDVDNDGDGVIDCADPDCFLNPVCQRCGNGVIDDGEACDDGNLKDGDGCSHACLLARRVMRT